MVETFGNNLKAARKALNMNQQALGQAIGVGQTTIANYEKGLRFPTGELLKRIAEILNVSLDELMGHQVYTVQRDSSEFDLEVFQDEFTRCLIDGREQESIAMIWSLHPSSENLLYIYQEILMYALIRIGHLWAEGSLNIAVEHYASHVIHKIIAMLSTIPAEVPKKGNSAVCMSMSDEPHTIGIEMVSEFFNLTGIQSYYIGTSVPVSSLMDVLVAKQPEILAVSLTMSTRLGDFQKLVDTIKRQPEFKNLKILAGGQAFYDRDLMDKVVGIDGCEVTFKGIKKWLLKEGML